MDKYQKKQTLLNSALSKVQRMLIATEESYQRTGIVAQNWNDIHDLEYRIKDRMRENWSAYHDWHLDTFGWNAY
jgi:hypothetical protein